jgi:glycosyltransferase involved in cell wall biosynthesis
MRRTLNIFILHPSDMLTDCRPHGDGLMADSFIRNLASQGHRLHVAVSERDLKEPYDSNVTLYRIDTGRKATGLAARIRFARGSYATFKRLARQGLVDVVHQLNPVVTGLSLPFWNCPCPLVLGPYVPDWPLILYNGQLASPRFLDRMKIRLKREIWQAQHRIADAIIVSTPAALSKVRDRSRYQSKIHVIPYGVDAEAFTPSPLPQEKVILFAGSLAQHKGVFVLLEAFRRVLRTFPDCTLLLAGDGPEAERAQRVVATFDNPASVRFLGRVSREGLPAVMQACSVFCIPSFGEAFGLVALEAMASGRPVVGTDASGLGYLIEDLGGRKAPVGDVDKLAQNLTAILGDPDLARSMGEHNRRTAEHRYTWPHVIEQLEEVYAVALAQREDARQNLTVRSVPSIADKS